MPKQAKRPLDDIVVVVVAGTFVADWYAQFVYGSLKAAIIERGYPVRIIAIPNLGLGSMQRALDSMHQQICAEFPTQRIVLIGHSQGGSHTMGLKRLLGSRAIRVVQLSAPNHGTRLANLGGWLKAFPAIGNMAAHSPVLRELRSLEEIVEEVEAMELISVMSVFDQLVLPFFASVLKGAKNIVIAPRFMHPLLLKLGFRRSNGVELVDGFADHLSIISHQSVLRLLHGVFDELEATLPQPSLR